MIAPLTGKKEIPFVSPNEEKVILSPSSKGNWFNNSFKADVTAS